MYVPAFIQKKNKASFRSNEIPLNFIIETRIYTKDKNCQKIVKHWQGTPQFNWIDNFNGIKNLTNKSPTATNMMKKHFVRHLCANAMNSSIQHPTWWKKLLLLWKKNEILIYTQNSSGKIRKVEPILVKLYQLSTRTHTRMSKESLNQHKIHTFTQVLFCSFRYKRPTISLIHSVSQKKKTITGYIKITIACNISLV